MTERLRPMGLGEILDRTFHIYRSRFFAFVILASLPCLLMLVLQLANQFWWKVLPDNDAPRVFLWYTSENFLYFLALGHAEILFNLILWPFFALIVSRGMLDEHLTAFSAVGVVRSRWRSTIGLALTNWSLALIVPEALLFGLLAGTAYLLFEVFKLNADDPMQLGPRMFLAALVIGWVAFQWLSAGLSFSFPAWIVEESRIRTAIRRGWLLSRGSKLRVLFTRFLPIVIAVILRITLGSLVLFVVSPPPCREWLLPAATLPPPVRSYRMQSSSTRYRTLPGVCADHSR